MDCEFCDIVSGGHSAHVVHSGEEAVAFLDIHPAVPGHTLVAPTAHRAELFDLADDEVAAMFRTVRDVAIAQRAALDAAGVSVFQSSGEVAGQDVFHVHAHVIPRFEDDNIRFAPARTPLTDEAGADIAAAIQAEL